ncbi:hypothetical protein EVA_09535, partial [gut metagenome]
MIAKDTKYDNGGAFLRQKEPSLTPLAEKN